MRAANYARYSSENQRETSITDQFYLGDVYAQRAGWPAPIRFSDSEISASTPTLLRPGGRALMEAIRAGQIDVLLIEALDRCWRDIVDQERTIREIEHLGVRIIGISDGYDSNREGRELQRIIIGGVNQQYLRDLAKKVHRSHTGIAMRGMNAGGLAYGYRSVPDGDGHRLQIDDAEAAVVRWIFASYADGMSLREIVYDLNARAIQSPRGGTWAISALFGSPAKGSGILNNTLYAGRYVWNRSQWVKHPDTGIRKRKERDRSEWIVQPRPDLRIVDEETWAKVERRMSARKPMKTGRRPSYLLSGILRCGVCGGAYVVVYRGQYGCAAHRDRGQSVCGNGLRVRREDLERDILAAVKADLLAPDKVEAFRRELAAALKEARREDRAGPLRSRVERLNTEIGHMVSSIRAGVASSALHAALEAAERERDDAEAELVALTVPVPEIIPGAVDEYRRMIEGLQDGLGDTEATRADLAELLGHIPLTPVPGEQMIEANLEWAYTGLLRIATGGRMQTTVVAGAGFSSCLRFKASGKVVQTPWKD